MYACLFIPLLVRFNYFHSTCNHLPEIFIAEEVYFISSILAINNLFNVKDTLHLIAHHSLVQSRQLKCSCHECGMNNENNG